MPDWITTDEAARLSGYHPVYLRALLVSGKIKGQKWGREWQVSRKGLLAYVQKMENAGERRGPKPKRGD